MLRTGRLTCAAILLVALLSGAASAEKIVSVNDNAAGVFDQPSAVSDGSVVHLAYIGADNISGPFTVHYAAVNGSSDFGSLALTAATPGFFTVAPVRVLDNAGTPAASSAYSDARHPRIGRLSADRLYIFFQAKENPADADYLLYRARIVLGAGTVSSIQVEKVTGIPSGDIRDVSFGVVAADNTARLAFARRAPGGAGPFQVHYARVGLDNATAVFPPIPLSSGASTQGTRPVPSLKLDGAGRAHIAWAADGGTDGGNARILYAMVKESRVGGVVVEHAAIAATPVIDNTRRWGFPQVMTATDSLVYLLAADQPGPGLEGSLAYVHLNPDAAAQDNASVTVAADNTFLLVPPGNAILSPEFDLYRPEAFLDPSGRIHLTGYGYGTSPVYYAASPVAVPPYFGFGPAAGRRSVGLLGGARAVELPGDYTRAAFVYLNGRTLVFWSDLAGDNTSRNLNVTSEATVTEPVPFEESGCSVAPGRSGSAGTLPGALLPALPLALLKARRWWRRILAR